MRGQVNAIVLLLCLSATLALRIEMPTPQDILNVQMKAAKARMDSSSYLQNEEKLSDTQTPISKLDQADAKLSPLLSLPMNIASTMLKGNSAHMAEKQGLSAAHDGEETVASITSLLKNPKLLTELPGADSRLGPRAQEFAREAKEDHGDQWLQIALKVFQKKECPDKLLSGYGQVLPAWTVLALKDGGAEIDRSTNGVMLDWMRYGNFCGNQMHGNGYGDMKIGGEACNARNQKVTPYHFRGLSYDVCDDCGLDAGCAIHDSSWVHQVVNAETSEKGPTMCAANEAFATKMHESTHTGCSKNFKDGFGVPESGYVKLASCAMVFAPCINYEGPSLKILARVNPVLYTACKIDNQGASHIKFLACVASHYMNYRVPLGDYSGIRLKCTPEDATCFIQGDARSAAVQKELDRKDMMDAAKKNKDGFGEDFSKSSFRTGGDNSHMSLLERSHSSLSSSIQCGPIASPTMALCRAVARHIVVGEGGQFSLASDALVREREPLTSQDLISLDQELNADPEVVKILIAQVKPNTIKPLHLLKPMWTKKPNKVEDDKVEEVEEVKTTPSPPPDDDSPTCVLSDNVKQSVNDEAACKTKCRNQWGYGGDECTEEECAEACGQFFAQK